MKLRLSFQGWILGGCFLVVLCTLIFVGIILQHSVRGQLMQSIRSDMRSHLALVSEIVRDRWPQPADLSSVDALADELGNRLGLRVTLIRQDGVVLGDSEVSLAGLRTLENHSGRPEVKQALAGGPGASVRHSTTLGLDLLYVAHELKLPGGQIVVVRLAMPLAAIARSMGEVRQLIVGAVLLGLLLSTGMAYLVARGISRPVKELTSTATAITGGDLSQRFRRYPRHEVGDLGRAFDQMAESLQNEIEAVRRARDRRAAILRGMREGVLVTDALGDILLTNQALRRLLGLPEAPEGRPASEIIRNAELLEALAAVRAGRPHVVAEMRTLGPERRVLEINAVRISGEEPAGGCVAVLHDVTELKRTDQVRRDFVANVSHELRTPLTAIRGSVETLLDGALESPPDAKRFCEMVARQVVRLEQLVEDLLDLAAIEAGEDAREEDEVAAAELADSVLATVSELAKARGVELRTELPRPDLSFWSERRALEQAVLNLLDNAVKYTPAGGLVTLAIAQAGDMVRISVSDTGVGIAPEHQPRIFERFYRVDKTRSRELGGTGLGLAIVKHTAKALGGRVELQSAPGKGSTFSLLIPA